MLEALGHGHKYVVSRLWTHKPIILTHSLTLKCNCKCKTCDVRTKKANTHEMKTHEVFRLLDEASKLNFVAYLAWGGEPFIRPDVMDILKHAHDLDLYTSVITNGTYLLDNAEEASKVVDLTWVSLDYYSDYHDEIRGLKGTFGRAIKGIIKLRDKGGRIAINCVLSKLNTDAVRKMAELAQDLHVKLAFDPMEVFPGINEEYALSRIECRRLFREVFELKRLGYPILNSYEFLAHLISPVEYSCAQPKIFIRIHENGEITPFWCQKNDHVLGDLRNQGLGEVLYSAPFEKFTKMTAGCNLCKNSSTVEVSMFHSSKRFLRNCFKIPNPILQFIADYGL
jgi:MoaA/NifB/PqqE/SkfB family radical SAM enzyme